MSNPEQTGHHDDSVIGNSLGHAFLKINNPENSKKKTQQGGLPGKAARRAEALRKLHQPHIKAAIETSHAKTDLLSETIPPLVFEVDDPDFKKKDQIRVTSALEDVRGAYERVRDSRITSGRTRQKNKLERDLYETAIALAKIKNDYDRGTNYAQPKDYRLWDDYKNGELGIAKTVVKEKTSHINKDNVKQFKIDRRPVSSNDAEWVFGHTFSPKAKPVSLDAYNIDQSKKYGRGKVQEGELIERAKEKREEATKSPSPHELLAAYDQALKKVERDRYELTTLMQEKLERDAQQTPQSINEIVSEKAPEPEIKNTPEAALIPFEYPEEIQQHIDSLGINIELFEKIPEFEEIRKSEGKLEWILNKLGQIKLKRIHNEAVDRFEREVREGKFGTGIFGKVKTDILRKKHIRQYEQELIITFSFEAYEQDIKDVVHLASIAPDMYVKTNEHGERRVITQYFNIDPNKPERFEHYNEMATRFAEIPPEYEWSKYPLKQQKEWGNLKINYEYERDVMLRWVPGYDIQTEVCSKDKVKLIMNDADFSIKMHQIINTHPKAEFELKKLSELSEDEKKWDQIKHLFNVNGRGTAASLMSGVFSYNSALMLARMGVRSALVGVGATLALPLAAIGFGAVNGYMRGKAGAKEQLRREDELVRLGKEEIKSERGLNFVKADQLAKKIEDLSLRIATTQDELGSEKEEWKDRLIARLSYAQQKMNEHKIAYATDNELGSSYRLLKAIGEARATLSLNPPRVEFAKKHSRNMKLNALLKHAEERIQSERKTFVRHEGLKGAEKGALFSSGGAVLGILGSHLAQDFFGRVTDLTNTGQYIEAKQLVKTVELAAHTEITHQTVQDLAIEYQEEITGVIESTDTTEPSLPETPLGVEQILVPQVEVSPEPPKLFEVVLTKESQSREYALIKYYQAKGETYADASRKAHLYFKQYGARGEAMLDPVHKGQVISISEVDGQPHVEVGSAKNNVIAEQFVIPDESLPITDSSAEALAQFEVNTPTNIAHVIERVVASDPRFDALTPTQQDVFVLKSLIRLLDEASTRENPTQFFRSLGISSGNPFVISGGTLNLSKVFDTRSINALFGEAETSSQYAADLRSKMTDTIAMFKIIPSERINDEIKEMSLLLGLVTRK